MFYLSKNEEVIIEYLSKEDKESEKFDGPEEESEETKVTERPRSHNLLSFLQRQIRIAMDEGEFC